MIKYNAEPGPFDFDQLTALTRSIGFVVVTAWEVLDGRVFAGVSRG